MIPIVAGLLMGAAMGGGIAALQKKDILQGALMGGVGGALGGAFMPGVAGAAAGEGIGATASSLGNVSATELTNQGILNAAGNLTPTGAAQFMGSNAGFQALPGVTDGVTGAISSGSIAVPPPVPVAGANNLFGGGIGNFMTQNKYALAGGALGGMMAPGQEPDPADQGNIRDYTYSQTRNPEFGVTPGASYFNQGYTAGAITPAEDYTAANGGIIALAEGGQALELAPYQPVEANRYSAPVRTMTPEVAAYNQQLMARANQQYNVNPRPLPIQVPGSPGYVAPTFNAAAPSASTGEFGYDPVTRRYTGIGGLDKKEKTELERMREEMDALRGEQMGYNHASGDGGDGGMANGGLSSLGDYSDGGRLLRGPGDGVSDDIPARIGARQPARLADGEFVVPARIVSEIGNGSTDAGAKRLYAMMDRVQKGRKKSVGKGKVAVDSKAHKMLPA
jgi:hypothetical protein